VWLPPRRLAEKFRAGRKTQARAADTGTTLRHIPYS